MPDSHRAFFEGEVRLSEERGIGVGVSSRFLRSCQAYRNWARVTVNPDVMKITSTSGALDEERELESGHYNRELCSFRCPLYPLSTFLWFCQPSNYVLFSYSRYLPRCEFAFRWLHNQELNIKRSRFPHPTDPGRASRVLRRQALCRPRVGDCETSAGGPREGAPGMFSGSSQHRFYTKGP